MEPGRPLAGTSSGTVPPKRVFGDFLRGQKVTRRRLWNGLDELQGPRPCYFDKKRPLSLTAGSFLIYYTFVK